MRKVMSIFLLSCFSASASYAVTDARFFGTYCGSASIHECVHYKVCFFLGWPCFSRTRCGDVAISNIRVQVEHRESAARSGLIEGTGTANARGVDFDFGFGGKVLGEGLARGAAAGNFFPPSTGRIELSSDGLAITVKARGESLTIRKDACGNNRPEVAITGPSDGVVFEYGDIGNVFNARVTSDEDAAFPQERMVFASDRDGVLHGATHFGDRSMVLFDNGLSPGNHEITFSATDSGGLTGSASINVTITDSPPDVPVIIQPLVTDTIVATGDIAFEGKGYDSEEGFLKDESLIWSVSRAGGPFSILGSGQYLKESIDSPGEYVVRLTAIDSQGSESFTENHIAVLPYTGNTTPRVVINKPEHTEWRGRAMAVAPNTEIQFVGGVEDTEDFVTDLELKWVAQPIRPEGDLVEFGHNDTNPRFALEAIAEQDTEYAVTFSARDTGGLVGKKVIYIVVMATPLI